MGSGKSPLTVAYSRSAQLELDEIWDWNAKKRGAPWATNYIAFLRDQVDLLAADPNLGKPVEAAPNLRFSTVKFRAGRQTDGHVIVYRFDLVDRRLRVLHVFHSKQDWVGKLERGEY